MKCGELGRMLQEERRRHGEIVAKDSNKRQRYDSGSAGRGRKRLDRETSAEEKVGRNKGEESSVWQEILQEIADGSDRDGRGR